MAMTKGGTIGVDLVTIALLDDSGDLLAGTNGLTTSGIFVISDEVLGTNQANVTNLEGTVTEVYGNNGAVDSSTGKGNTSVAFVFNALPTDVKHKILGEVSDGKGGWLPSQIKPRVAVLIKSHHLDGTDVFYGFGNGKFTLPTANLQTSTNTEQRVTDAMTYTALDVPAWKQNHKTYEASDANFTESAMMSEVFGGYTTSTGASATAPAK